MFQCSAKRCEHPLAYRHPEGSTSPLLQGRSAASPFWAKPGTDRPRQVGNHAHYSDSYLHQVLIDPLSEGFLLDSVPFIWEESTERHLG